MNDRKILKTAFGLFGPISVGRNFFPSIYWMAINNEIEGQVYADEDGRPGSIAFSRYFYGFIILAWHFPKSHGLILGLGAGIGATMLLTLFPELKLTVVEIDSQVIQLAREFFPLVSFYEAQERLNIVESSAENYVLQCEQKFTFALLDLFSGDEKNDENERLLEKILQISPYFMANIITSEAMRPETPREWMWLRAAVTLENEKVNWLLTNIQSILPAIQEFQLFDGSCQPRANIVAANEIFRYILSQIDAACFYRGEP